jgi:hypothetical protein
LKSEVGKFEQRDIESLVSRILRDLGNPEPPLSLPQVRDLLALDLKYYSSTDVSFLSEVAHRIRVANKQIFARPGIILDVLRKANLSGLWLPDNRGIYIDRGQPEAKHRWIEAHEITHSFVPWHQDFLLGDNELTLNPGCHEAIEAEANFGAGRLLFHGERFAQEARDLSFSLKSVMSLKTRYGNTLTTTFWRFVEDRDPSRPTFGLISRHPRHPSIGGGANGADVHHFVVNDTFAQQFSKSGATVAYELLSRHATWSKRGPVMQAVDYLVDDAGEKRSFGVEGFCNSYQVLTMGMEVAR